MFPQHFASPPVATAQVQNAPAAIAVTPELRPETPTGVLLDIVVPLPSSPSALYPQHFAPPPIVTAQVWTVPAEIAATPEVRPETSTGVALYDVVVPFPSWPETLLPQHFAPPPVVTAQV